MTLNLKEKLSREIGSINFKIILAIRVQINAIRSRNCILNKNIIEIYHSHSENKYNYYFFLFFEFFQTYVSKIIGMEKIFELDSDSELNIFFYPSLEVDYKLDIGIVFGYDTFIKFIHKTHS